MEQEKKIYYKNIQRPCSLTDVKAWHLGESLELKKWIGTGYYNTSFLCKNKIARAYYSKEECDKTFEILRQKLTEELFDDLCDSFFELIEKSKITYSPDELFKINVKCWPAWTIFDEISKYPEIASEDIIRRLIRVRKNTEKFSYELSKRLTHEHLEKDYIFFKGNIHFLPFEHFTRENNIIIENEH